jgi:hypothetical protein
MDQFEFAALSGRGKERNSAILEATKKAKVETAARAGDWT